MVGQLKTNNAELNINKKYAHANPISIKNQLKIIIYVGKDSTINIKSDQLQASKYAQSHVYEKQLNR